MALPIVCALAAWLVMAGDFGSLSSGFGTIGTQAGPNVEASARLYYDLADLDGQVANMLLVGDADNLGETSASAYAAYQADLADANVSLEQIGSGVDAIPNGPTDFVSIENDLSQYQHDVADAMYIDGQAHGRNPAQPPAAALADYQQASALMHQNGTGVLALSLSLVDADHGTVDAAYGSALGGIGQLRIWGIVVLALALLALCYIQRRLALHFKRRVNPALALATLLTFVLGVSMVLRLNTVHQDYVTQKSAAFDSVIALWQEKAESAEMNAAESRWLLDLGTSGYATGDADTAASEEQDFYNQEQAILGVAADPPVETDSSSQAVYLSTLAATLGNFGLDGSESLGAENTGELYDELENVTFAGEDEDAVATLQTYAVYIKDDSILRAEADGSAADGLATAVAFDTGQSNADFEKYIGALEETLNVNASAFVSATADGQGALGPWQWLPAVWAALVAVLVLLGFAPRLREYR
jgi:hypothetical protein